MNISDISDFSISVFVLGIILITIGLIQFNWPPKKMNDFYGYRTNRSMKNQESWNFAQTYVAKLYMKHGLLTVLFSGAGFIYPKLPSFIAIILIFVIIIYSTILTDKKLKEKFKKHD